MTSNSIFSCAHTGHFRSENKMAPTVQPPPPPLLDKPPGHRATAPLAAVLRQLNELLFGIALPKTKSAKLVSLSLDVLHQSHHLISLAQSTLEDPCPDPQLTIISKHLEAISTHIGLPNYYSN